jgi:hypothetical protein
VITVGLDAWPSPGSSSLAWEALDAIILNAPPDEQRLTELLAFGITIAVRSEQMPDTAWPWRRIEAYWVLRMPLAGPRGAIGGEAAYLPSQSWSPGQPANVRRIVVLVAVLITLLLSSTLLTGPRWSMLTMIMVVALCGGGIEWWRRLQPPLRHTGADVFVFTRSELQADSWSYVTPAGRTEVSGQSLHPPMLVDRAHAERIGLRLHCRADGASVWRYTLQSQMRLAFMQRQLLCDVAPFEGSSTRQSPLLELVRRAYLDGQTQIVGEMWYKPEDAWPSVVLERRQITSP